MNLKQRMEDLKAIEAKLPDRLAQAAKAATMRAVEKAVELTPPTVGSLSGSNTRTGEMKQHWVSDSKINPVRSGDRYATELNNDQSYASYVNDGHRMDRHFVPGLSINSSSGLLEYNPEGKGGIVVGTQTSYVPGIFMVDKAKEEYRRVLREELKDLEDLLK